MLWHYTTYERWQTIRREGVIRKATARLSARERPVVWFTLSEQWDVPLEETYRDSRGNVWTLAPDEIGALAGGLVRIGAEPALAPYDWRQFKLLGGIAEKEAKQLYAAALKKGTQPRDWRVSFDDIPQDRWEIVQFFNGTDWSDDEAELPSALSDEERQEVIRKITSREPQRPRY